jgi:hypothetical protein
LSRYPQTTADEAAAFWNEVTKDGGPKIAIPSKNLRKNVIYNLGLEVTFKGKTKLIAENNDIYFQTYDKSPITKLA